MCRNGYQLARGGECGCAAGCGWPEVALACADAAADWVCALRSLPRDEDPDGFSVPSTAPYTDRNWDERSKKYAAMVHLLDRDIGRICIL